MADKEVTIKVTTEADASQLDDLTSSLDQAQQSADELGTAGSASADELSASLGESASSGDELSNSLANQDTSGLDDAKASADELSTNLDQADESAGRLSTTMGLVEGTMLLDVAGQIGAMGDSAEGMAQEMNTASISVGQLATQTGIAEPQMVSLINHISNATFPNDEAMMYVKSLDQIGVSSENLGKSATDLDKINDAFGLGAGTVNSLGQELSVLGVDMNNVSSSFNALAYANANTVGGMENYYTFLKKYDAQFNELGFNVDQASVIIAGATQKFGGGRAALSGLSEALKESNGDTRALEEALDLEAGSIENASALTGQYEGTLQTLANEEMEHKTFLDQINAGWEDMQLALSPVLSPLMSLAGIIGGFGQFALSINSLITLAQTFGLLNAETLALIPSQIAEGIAGLFSIGWILIAVAIILILIGILAYLYFTNEDVRNAINGLGEAFMNIAGIIYNAIVGVVTQVIGALQGLWNYIMTLGGLLPANVNITGNNIIDSILRVIMFISTLPIQLQIIFINTIARVLGFGNNFTQNLISGAVNAVNGFINHIRQLPGMIQSEFARIESIVSNFITSLPSRVWDLGASIVDALKGALGIGSPGHMYYMFEGELFRLKDAPVKLGSDIYKNVGDLGQGIVDSFGAPNLNLDLTSLNEAINSADLDLSLNNEFINKDVSDAVNTSGETNNVVNLTLNVGSVDKKERVDEIIDTVRDYFMWNNTTAGRTV